MRPASRPAMLLRAACCWLALAGTAAAAEQRLALEYDVHYGPLRLMSIRTQVDLHPDRYRTSSRMQTEGMIGLLFPWTAESVSEGLRGPLRPRHHASEGRFRGQRRVVEIAYGENGAVTSRTEPAPDADWRDLVPPEDQRATVDPLTASLAAMEQRCRGHVPVFDGRRRYDLRLEEVGDAVVEDSSCGVYAGPATRCRARIEPRGGFWRTDGRESETPSTLEIWIATPQPALGPLPVYLELTGTRGTLRIHLTRVDGSGAQG